MPTYSPEFKEAVMARMLPPGSESMNRISRETGVCLTTLRKWKQRALGEAGLRERAEGRERQVPSLSRRFQIVAAAAGLSDEELSAYARSQGLHVDQIKQYRRDCLQADVLISKLEQDHPPVQSAQEVQLQAAQNDSKPRTRSWWNSRHLWPLQKKSCASRTSQDHGPVTRSRIA